MLVTGIYPQSEIKQTEKGFECSLDLPGTEKDDINVKYQNDWIIISAIRNRNGFEEKINRTFYAPNAKNIKAAAKNGVLYVTGEYEKGSQIEIKWEK